MPCLLQRIQHLHEPIGFYVWMVECGLYAAHFLQICQQNTDFAVGKARAVKGFEQACGRFVEDTRIIRGVRQHAALLRGIEL